MSARMKSSSADPDFVGMSRFKAAMEAWLRPISSATMAGSVSIGAGAPPAGLVHGPACRQLPQGDPERLHGVGHHLRMTDGDVDVVLSVAGRGDGEQRGDRPTLDELEAIVDQAPFDVLGT